MKTIHRLLLCLFLISITTASFSTSRSEAKKATLKELQDRLLINMLKANWKTIAKPPVTKCYMINIY